MKFTSKFRKFPQLTQLNQLKPNFFLSSRSSKFYSEKDDAFWEEYSKRKQQGGKVPALPSQNVVINEIERDWRYSTQHSLKNVEFKRVLEEIKKNEDSPFQIVDVREEVEYEIYKLPKYNKVT